MLRYNHYSDPSENQLTCGESPLYEEIKNPEASFTYTQNILYGASPGVAETGPDHEYEEVKNCSPKANEA